MNGDPEQVILTDTTIDSGSPFEFDLEDVSHDWTGALEIGLATRIADNNGTIGRKYTILFAVNTTEKISQNIVGNLTSGDTIGVIHQDATVHFFVNGTRMGPTLSGVPEAVYGLAILYEGSLPGGSNREPENRPTTTRQRPTKTEQRPTKTEQRPTKREQRPTTPDQRPKKPELRPTTGQKQTHRLNSFEQKLLEIPKYWSSDGSTGGFHSVTLAPTDTEYLTVKKKFIDTGGPDSIKSICRIENREMLTRYALSASQIDDKMSSKIVDLERTLYHGTNHNVIDKINQYGFNRTYAGKNAARFGRGTYFAAHAEYSCRSPYAVPDSQGLCYVYQCRVIVGQYCLGQEGMVEPEPLEGGGYHDSAVNDMKSPTIFVVFRDDRAYPDYLITYKESGSQS